MRIVRRAEWGARHANGSGIAPLPAHGLRLHHSAGPARNGAVVIRQLEDIGQQRFGAGISYTFAVTPDGTVYEGHSIGRRGTHTQGRNSTERAVCLVGNYERIPPTAEQEQAVADLLRYGVGMGWWPRPVLLGGHRDVATNGTACPGGAAYARIGAINTQAQTGALMARLDDDDRQFIRQQFEWLIRSLQGREPGNPDQGAALSAFGLAQVAGLLSGRQVPVDVNDLATALRESLAPDLAAELGRRLAGGTP